MIDFLFLLNERKQNLKYEIKKDEKSFKTKTNYRIFFIAFREKLITLKATQFAC